MKTRDDGFFLLNIVTSYEKISDYLAGIRLEVFLDTSLLQDAVVRNFEIIGEAAKNISTQLKERYPQIDWRGMSGLRNILIHQYFGIDYVNIWNISQITASETIDIIKTVPEYQVAFKHSCEENSKLL